MTAAAKLLGLTLHDGWKVTKKIEPSENATGGTFSHSYFAEKDGATSFVKAFDFSEAFEPGVETLTRLTLLTSAYENERDILDHCASKKHSRVATAIGHGSVQVAGLGQMEGRVYYLMFERADGDIRCQMDEAKSSDMVWCMQALRDACLGLAQVHGELIAHQDLKPSNVLAYESDGMFRIADFGKSSRRGSTVWHNETNFPGDRTYAPPELLYGHIAPDFQPRRIGTDLYLLGNLAAFLFTGTNITASLFARMDRSHHWTRWGSDYEAVLPYVQEAFGRVLEELELRLPSEVREEVMMIVRDLCNPDLSKRGHPKSLGRLDQYSLERYVSHLTQFVKALEINARIARNAA